MTDNASTVKSERERDPYRDPSESNSPLLSKEFSFTHFSGHKLTTKEIPFCFSERSNQKSR